jgi:hypothetical protein
MATASFYAVARIRAAGRPGAGFIILLRLTHPFVSIVSIVRIGSSCPSCATFRAA